MWALLFLGGALLLKIKIKSKILPQPSFFKGGSKSSSLYEREVGRDFAFDLN
jgi:hypothetical protein